MLMKRLSFLYCIFLPLLSQISWPHLLLDHVQFTLIHGPNIPGSYAVLFFTTSDFTLIPVTSTTGYCVCFGAIPSFFLELLLLWFPVAYWAPTDQGVHLSVSYLFAFSSWGSQGKNTEAICHSFLQWTIFCQTSPPWPARPGWPHTAWLSFIEIDKAVVRVMRLANFLWLWFQCVCPLMQSSKE